MNQSKPLIVSVGSVIMDLLLNESDAFVATGSVPKGGQRDTSSEEIEKHLARSKMKPVLVPGGSAGNTIVGLGRLGARTRFIGKRGPDALGELYETRLRESGIEPLLSQVDQPTGRVLSLVTPDAQRTMYTFLGASGQISPEDLKPEQFEGAALVHFEAYLVFNEPVLKRALELAKKAGALIALDLANFMVIQAKKSLVDEIINDSVDVILANEDEAEALTGLNDEEQAARVLSQRARIAVVKVGKRGSFVASDGKVIKAGILGDGSAVDTTGAGDLWNSGFLYGLTHGLSLEKAARLGAACGFEVCQVMGASIPEEGWRRILKIKQGLIE